jgi:hypothetical protein
MAQFCYTLEFVVVETPFYLQAVYIHSTNWCEDWVLWLEEGHSIVPFRSYEPGGAWGNNAYIYNSYTPI